MTGGTVAHSAIQRNLITALATRLRLRGTPCQPYGSHLKIQVAGRIPLSRCLVVKNAEYRETPSILRYVVLQQSSAAAIIFSHPRRGDCSTDPDRGWRRR